MKKASLTVAQPVCRKAIGIATLAIAAQQASAAGFIEDSKATLTLRNFYINSDNREGATQKQEEWGQGFFLNYVSGYTQGPVGFGLDAAGILAVKLDSGHGRHGNLNSDNFGGIVFPSDEHGDAVDDFSYIAPTLKAKISKTEALIGGLQPKLPVIVYNDGRLVPQIFEGGQVTSKDIDNLTLVGGQIEHLIGRNSSNGEGLSIGGANNSKTGQFSNKFYYGGADYKIGKNLVAQYYYGNLEDFYKQHFLGLTHTLALPVGALKTDLRYFHSDSDGKNGSVAGRAEGYRSSGEPGFSGEVDNDTWSAFFTYSLGKHTLSGGYQAVNGDSAFPFINQGGGTGSTAYLITDRQIGKFLSAGERTWVAEYGYDFSGLGVPGLKAIATYLKGSDIEAVGGDQGEWERDFRLDYVLPSGPLKGLGFSWRNAEFHSDTSTADNDENRLIVSYTLPLL